MHKFSHLLASIALIAAILACNLPSGDQVNAALTAVALTLTAQALQPAAATPTSAAPPASLPSFTPSPTSIPVLPPTACSSATATAIVNANVRNGPGTDYDILGYIPVGGTAPITGRNDANTWWNIVFAGGPGGHAWIAQSVTSAACLPPVVVVIAAPPLPPTSTPGPGGGPFAVVHVTFSVSSFNEGSYHNCPIVTAHIETNGAGDVQYHWTRSDNAGAPVQNLHFNSAGTKNVQEKWYLGSVWAGGDPEWLGIYIDDPNHQNFGHVNVDACSSP